MIDRNVSRGMTGMTLMGGLAAGAVMTNVASLPKESRVKFVKGFVFVLVALIAALLAVVSLGLLSELAKTPVAERGMAVGSALVFALPAVAVLVVGLRKLFRK